MLGVIPELNHIWRFFDDIHLYDQKKAKINLKLVTDSLSYSMIFTRRCSVYGELYKPSAYSFKTLICSQEFEPEDFFVYGMHNTVFSLFFFKCFVERDIDYFDNFMVVETDLKNESFYKFLAFIQTVQFLNSFQKVQMLTHSDFWFFADKLSLTDNLGLGFHLAHWWLNWKALNQDGKFMLSIYHQPPELAEDDRLADTKDFLSKVFKKVSDIIKSGYFNDYFNSYYGQYCEYKGIEKSELKKFFSRLFSDDPEADTYVTVALDRINFFELPAI